MIDGGWFADDGLMKLDPTDNREPFAPKFPWTVGNSNGLMFRAVNELLRARAGNVSNGMQFNETALLCESEKDAGNFLRHPGDYQEDDAQDNMAGTLAACALFSNTTIPVRHHNYCEANGWEVRVLQGDGWSLRYLRQGGDRAYVTACCTWVPYLVDWIWLCAGILINAFASSTTTKVNHISNAQLTWVRLEGLSYALPRVRGVAPWLRPSFAVVRAIWVWRTTAKYDHELKPISDYYMHPQHPNKLLALKLQGVPA